jgi:hypothetical protein
MRIEQTSWTQGEGWQPAPPGSLNRAQLVLVFAGSSVLIDDAVLSKIRAVYANAFVFGCSTAGEICDTRVNDDSASVTAIQFDHTTIQYSGVNMEDVVDSFQAGQHLARALPREGLVHVFVLSDGIVVNGSEVVRGLTDSLPASVSITGGLSGDGDRFQNTKVIMGADARSNVIGLLGFYGQAIQIGYASLGGWDSFGPERLITRSKGNVLYELDGRSALDLYKQYLGEHAAGLPATGLLFPLSLRSDDETPVVRTILAVDDEQQSMTFAGDIPEGSYARLMKANFDRLVDGASDAAQTSKRAFGDTTPDLAILVSCVGRKMVLKQRIEEEVEAVRDVLGAGTVLTGFYSYGEISPFTPNARCELHNQTMTITTLFERAA